jgi:FkbM family methyltransferase
VLDVGANSGQFAASLREAGYQGRMVSFEPLSGAFADLERAAASDPLWSCINLALGEENCTAVINVSANSYSSSLLGVCDWSLSVEPSISAVGREEVKVRRLDSFFDEVSLPHETLLMKVDAQGFELPIVKGAHGIIDRLELIQLEASFRPVYRDEPPIEDVISCMRKLDFRIVSIDPGWEDQSTHELLQVDLLFSR